MIYEISNGKLTAKITDIGAELISVRDALGYEYIWTADENVWNGHAPILFPVCGRVKDGRILKDGVEYPMTPHGFARDLRYGTVEKTDSSVTMSLKACRETHAMYPFDFELTVRYELADTLRVSFNVKNTGSETLPYIIGWHPGFMLEDSILPTDYRVVIGKASAERFSVLKGGMVSRESEDYALPGGEYRINEEELEREDTIVLRGAGNECTLTADGAKHRVVLRWSENLTYFCIWRKVDADARYLCLEPWSGIPSDGSRPEDYATRDMNRLGSGSSEDFTFEVILE